MKCVLITYNIFVRLYAMPKHGYKQLYSTEILLQYTTVLKLIVL